MSSVDVVIPLFNGSRWIRETLDSALAQSVKPGKIIVVDDSSTDESRAQVYDRPEIALLRSPGSGANMARNHGLAQSTAEFVAFLDQDDLWHPDHLRLLVNALSVHTEAQAAISGIDFFKDREPKYDLRDVAFSLWDPWNSFPFIYEEDHTTSGMLFRSCRFREEGGWSVEHEGQSDYFAWYRSAIHGPAVKMRAVTFGCRKHEGSWMTEIRKDVLGQLESLIRAAGDLARLYQERKDDGRDESYLRRRVAVYQGFYSLIYNLSVRRDDLIERDLAAFEEILAREAPAFANLFVPDLGYFLDNLGENQELPRREYVRRLIRCCPQQALRCRAILAEHLAAQ